MKVSVVYLTIVYYIRGQYSPPINQRVCYPLIIHESVSDL
jgi:hypothetical protein